MRSKLLLRQVTSASWSSVVLTNPNITDKGGYLGSDHDEERSKERYITGTARYVTRQNLECILRLQAFGLTGLSGSVSTLHHSLRNYMLLVASSSSKACSYYYQLLLVW